MNTSTASTKRTANKEPEAIRVEKHPSGTMRKMLLYCGLFSSLWYVAINIIVPMYYPGYSISSQTVSELSAIGAPTRPLWVLLCIPYTLLVIAFGGGIWLSAGANRQLRITGILMLVYGFSGFFWAPMHQRDVLAAGGSTWSDTLHLAMGVVTELIFLLAMGFLAAALGKRFRLYSIVTFLVLLLFGILTFLEAPGVAANAPTPWIGIWERINIGVFLLWVIVLAMQLLRRGRKLPL